MDESREGLVPGQTVAGLIRAQLSTDVLGDILDLLGYRHQFLPQQIHPLHPEMVLVDRAMPHRDTRKALEPGWPVFSRGSFAQDAAVRSVVLDYRTPIEFGRTRVEPGEWWQSRRLARSRLSSGPCRTKRNEGVT